MLEPATPERPDIEDLKSRLTEGQFCITQDKGTEPPFTGEYWDCKASGVYHCRCCDEPLFSSETKYDSGSGWPSFWDALNETCVATESDTSYGMVRTEILCAHCEAHLGHVFNDGPEPTGLRFCVNSASLLLKAE